MTQEKDSPAGDKTAATILSATELEKFQTQPADPEATLLIKPDIDATVPISHTSATVLAGGTEALHDAMRQATAQVRVSIGSVIKDRFVLEKLLGRGGMGEVYLAIDQRKVEAQDKKPHVAFKVLNENFKRHPQAFIALQREARKTQELAHPNIITVYDFDRQGDIVYITMEPLTGKPMDEEIRNEGSTRPIALAVSLIQQCANGLAYAHKKGLVHSDLKPGNIFITSDGTVKLLDFGIARAFQSGKQLDEKKKTAHDDTVFDAGELGALTPPYASCEMLEGLQPHPSDDVYALGLIAYELLTGKHPFDKTMATKARDSGLVPARIKGITKQQWRAIERALAFSRKERIQNAQEFLDAFNTKSKTPFYIAGAVVTAAFIALGSYSYFKPAEVGPEIPFAELPVATQQQITADLKEAALAMQFRDFNGAIHYLDEAFTLHPHNPEVMAKVDKLVEQLVTELAASGDKAAQKEQVNALLEYGVLANNKKLLEYRDSLQ